MWYPLISTPGIRDAYLAISWPLVREAARWVLLLLLLFFLFESNRLPVPWTISSVDATRIRRGPSHTRGVYTCAHVYRFKKTVPSSPFSSRNRYSEPFFGRRPTAFETAFIVLRFFLPFRFGSRLTNDTPQKIENGIWFRGEMRLHGMAKTSAKEMDQDAILDGSLSTWRWEIEISYCSIILFPILFSNFLTFFRLRKSKNC